MKGTKYLLLILLIFLSVFIMGESYGEDLGSSDLNVSDQYGQVWQNQRQVNIFGPNTPLLKPGIEGSYQFMITNVSNLSKDYQLSFKETNAFRVPILYQITENESYILGQNQKFQHLPFDMKRKKITLLPNQAMTYQMNWQWDKNSTDEQDTYLGKQSFKEPIYYQLEITIQEWNTEETEKDSKEDEKDSRLIHVFSDKKYPQMNEKKRKLTRFGFLFIVCSLVVAYYLKKKEQDHEK